TGEIAPEIAQQLAPGDFIVGNSVELLFEIGRETIFNVASEETLQEGGEHATLVLRDKPFLVEPHVAAVLKQLKDRVIGGRPADAEFLHALDERSFRIARRRLGEMLARVDFALVQRLAGTHFREAARILTLGIVLTLLIEREKAVELHHGS